MTGPRRLELVLARLAPPAQDAQDRRADDARRRRVQSLERTRLPLTEHDTELLVEDRLRDDVGPCWPAVRAWDADPAARKWLVLCGPPGRGKTLAAAWWLLQHGGRYVGARELERLRQAGFGLEAAEYQLMHDTAHVVVDDLGREEQAPRLEQALLDLVDYRRRRGMRTIAIANLTRAKLQERYPDTRLWSRLDECAQFVADRGPDLRRAKGGAS